MGERKVQSRYIPPDIDPSKRLRNPHRIEQGRMEIRNMLPFSIWCLSCSNFMVRGTKFNSKVEDVVGEDYVGIKLKRIIGKCSQCSAIFSYKTDLKNIDYTMEGGATRNFELWKDTLAEKEEAARDKAQAEEFDPMRALEHRTEESRRQMEEMDYLAELRARAAARVEAGVGPEAALAALARRSAGGAGGAGGGGDGGGEWGGEGAAPAMGGEAAEALDAELASAAFAAARGAKRQRREPAAGEAAGGGAGGSSSSSATGGSKGGLAAFGARFVVKPAAAAVESSAAAPATAASAAAAPPAAAAAPKGLADLFSGYSDSE